MEERKRTFTWEDPTIGSKQSLQMSGIDYLNSMLEGKIPPPPIMHAMDFKIKSIKQGEVIFYFLPQEFHYNPIGSVHGGVISTILDSAMGCTIHSVLPTGKAYTTLELKVNFLRPITKDTGELICSGKVIHAGGKTGLVEAQVTDQLGKVYAHGVSTCLVFSIP